MESKLPFKDALDVVTSARNSQEKLEKLCYILTQVRYVLKNIEEDESKNSSICKLTSSKCDLYKHLWKSREKTVLAIIANEAFEIKDFLLAVEVVQTLIELEEENDRSSKEVLMSVLGQMYLQLGDVDEAERVFNKVKKSTNRNDEDFQSLMNKGLLAVGRNNFQEAFEHFDNASVFDTSKLVATNNKAVCLLYSGRVKDTIPLLAEAARENAAVTFTRELNANLKSAQHLESSNV